jgi:hypothetical protein
MSIQILEKADPSVSATFFFAITLLSPYIPGAMLEIRIPSRTQ